MFKFKPSKEWLENSLKQEADHNTTAGGIKMSKNAEVKSEETKGPVQKFKQAGTTTFKSYDEADAHRKQILPVEGEKVRVKYRAHRGEYDVVRFNLLK